ncbi:MAG: hypothetical protein A2X86_20000 [Bdellovibrionales bacterium GWA2_49_15]|nr:MAG: hypothetical protein A2X86_20000 [Bdellovibrionales bacterium GWA2_49_15]HAZ11403.1 hypothetical protein [Bdellovibrionales bacterium]
MKILLIFLFISNLALADTTAITFGNIPFIFLNTTDYDSTNEKIAEKKQVTIRKTFEENDVINCQKIAIVKAGRGESLIKVARNCEIIIEAMERRARKIDADTLLVKLGGYKCKQENLEGIAYKCEEKSQ